MIQAGLEGCTNAQSMNYNPSADPNNPSAGDCCTSANFGCLAWGANDYIGP